MKASTLTRALSLLAACFALSASAHADVVLSGGGLALVEEGGVIASGNLSATGTAFAKDLLPGYPSHQIHNLNDQLFGNAESWIGNTTGTFAGVSFGATAVQVSSIAFGRDNNGAFTDRTLGTYTLQYTTVANPTKDTLDASWTTIGTLDYQSAGGTNFAFPSKRHRYTFNTVAATGIRLLVPEGGLSAGTCIDELEAYSSAVTTTADIVTIPADSGAGSLREVIAAAVTASGANTITFASYLSGQTITLASEIVISDTAPVTIDATNLPNGITIDGGPGTNRIFSIPAGQTVTLNRLTLTGGGGTGATASGSGGAIYNASSLLTLTNCSFQGNSGSHGGGIYNLSSSPTLTNCSFQGNSASTDGGGIYNNLSSPTLTNCTFQGNSASAWGGGMFNVSSSPTLRNCSFQGNSATGYAGGIFNHTSSSPILTNCSFQGNSAGLPGGGIFNYNSSSPTLNNCIIWNNKDNSGIGTADSSVGNLLSSPPTYSHCLVQNIDLTGSGTGNLNGTLSSNNPLFVREVDPNSAPTTGGDLRLRAGSPAIDAGSNSLNATSTDLGGKPRVIDGNMDNIATIDLGAHEWRRVFVKSAVSGGNQDGTSWANAFTHLQSALAAAQAGDEIWVATGTYFPDEGTGQTDNARASTFALKAGVGIYGGFPGNGTPVFADRNPVTNLTTLSGDIGTAGVISDNAYHVLTAFGAAITASTILDGFTITAGNANEEFYPYYLGGGLFCSESASPTLTNCSFQGNSATYLGGGIYNRFSSPTLTNCSFQGNSAPSGEGGGISNSSSSPTLTNCSFLGNSAVFGGGISNTNSSPTLTNCSFLGNSAEIQGGGIYNSDSSPTLNNCSFQGNSTQVGGGIFNENSSPTLTNCSFLGNSANGGGGIFNWEDSSPILTNCSFLGNSAGVGGGICNQISNAVSSSPTLTNCSFLGNSAEIQGGGIFNSGSSPILTNCIIWNNAQGGDTIAPGASVYNDSGTPAYSHCLIQGYSKADLDTTGTSPDTNLAPTDPLFVREVDPNLPVQQRTGGDLRLLTGSPALNVGNNAANTSTTDLAGNPRKVGTIDLGAYEGNLWATFALLHPTLSPAGDANGNGISNYGDYAAGGNPSAPDDPTLRPKLIGNQLTFSFRNNATDIAKEFQKSTTLLPGSWNPLVLTTDYTVSSTTSSGGRTLQALTLTNTLLTGNPKLFFRQISLSPPPP